MLPKPKDSIGGATKITFSLTFSLKVLAVSMLKMLPEPGASIGGARKLTFSLKDFHVSMLKCY